MIISWSIFHPFPFTSTIIFQSLIVWIISLNFCLVINASPSASLKDCGIPIKSSQVTFNSRQSLSCQTHMGIYWQPVLWIIPFLIIKNACMISTNNFLSLLQIGEYKISAIKFQSSAWKPKTHTQTFIG